MGVGDITTIVLYSLLEFDMRNKKNPATTEKYTAIEGIVSAAMRLQTLLMTNHLPSACLLAFKSSLPNIIKLVLGIDNV